MQSMCRLALVTLLLAVVAPCGRGQVATGTYTHGTFDNQGFDTINVGNLNVHFSIPVLNKAGRGIPFVYNLAYDSSVWYPQPVNGSFVWAPTGLFGWSADTATMTGTVSFSTTTATSIESGGPGGTTGGTLPTCTVASYSKWVYYDPLGTPHPFYGSTSQLMRGDDLGCPQSQPSFTETASDGSGYTLTVSLYRHAQISTAKGIGYLPLQSAGGVTLGTVTDTNGNRISVDTSGNFTDTSGHVVLTASGAAPTKTLTYYDTNGNPQKVTIQYKQYTVQTAFGCSTVGEYGPVANYLVDTVTLADNVTTYSFEYEDTPNGSGNKTGRIASITLPQGGTISYSYPGSNHGIECADGSASALQRSLALDAGSAASTWTYTRTTGSGTSQTAVVDGLGNNKTYSFVLPSNLPSGAAAEYYETQRRIYQGAATATPVVVSNIGYNGNASGAAFSLPITQIYSSETLDGIQTRSSFKTYSSSSGAETEADDYDFSGSLYPVGSLLRKDSWTYGYSIATLPTKYTISDANGLAGERDFTYDGTTPTASSGVPQHVAVSGPRGNLTSETVYFGTAGRSYGLSATYEDTGSTLTSTSPSGTTTYSYDSSFLYNTGTSLPTPASGVALATGASYDTAETGLPLSSTGFNAGQTTQYSSYDSMLRLKEADYPDGGKTTLSYSPTQTGTQVYQSSGVASDTEIEYDGYGRQSRIAVANGQSGSSWYQQDTCYDANGNVSFKSYGYQGTGFSAAKVCSGAGDTYTYDVLGRVKLITHGNGETVTYSYTGRATQITDENGVSRISQVDGLGRPTIVCEISSNGNMPGSGAPGSCSTDIPGTGFTTTYSYNLATGTTIVTQGGQTRTFQTDWLGRPTSVTEPESGTTTYTYDYNTTGLLVTRKKPKANQTDASVLTTTTTQYDSIGRVVSIAYDDGTPTKTFVHDKTAGGNWSDLTQGNNLKGQLSAAYVSNAGTAFSYDAMGRVTDLDQCLPSGCGTTSYNKQLRYTYDLAGNMLSSTDGAGAISTYTVSPASEVLSLTSSLSDTTHPANLVSSILNGPNGPMSYNLGNNLSGGYSYDTLGRLNGGWVIHSGSPAYCYSVGKGYKFKLTWKGDRLLNSTDTVLGQASNYTYDEFDRLTAQNTTSGTTQNMTWTYDRWGNRRQQTASNGPQPSFSFNTANNQINGFTYDAAGNLINDGYHTYAYDADGNMTAVDGGSTAQYVYDALNHRVRTVVGGTATEFVFNSAGQRVSVWNGSTRALLRGQYYWGSKPVAYYANGSVHFQHQNWAGTERLRTTYNGGVESTFTSLPFGDNQTASGIDGDAYHYAMLDHDSEDNTDHAQFRQYNNTQGRWMSPDPYGGSYDAGNPQSMNRYVYALNNPLSFRDPSGLYCQWEDGTHDEEPAQGGDDYQQCVEDGGSWMDTTSVTVNGDNPNDPGITYENGDMVNPIVIAPSKIAKAICGALPSGTVVSVSGNGNFVGTSGSLDLVTNLRTGEVTGFFSPGYFAGAATAGGSITGGYTFGNLGSGNSNFSGGFTGVSGGYGIIAGSVSTSSGGPASPFSGINPTASGHVTTVSAGVQTPGRALALNTVYSLPNQLGKYWTLADPVTAIMYAANQLCSAVGY